MLQFRERIYSKGCVILKASLFRRNIFQSSFFKACKFSSNETVFELACPFYIWFFLLIQILQRLEPFFKKEDTVIVGIENIEVVFAWKLQGWEIVSKFVLRKKLEFRIIVWCKIELKVTYNARRHFVPRQSWLVVCLAEFERLFFNCLDFFLVYEKAQNFNGFLRILQSIITWIKIIQFLIVPTRQAREDKPISLFATWCL